MGRLKTWHTQHPATEQRQQRSAMISWTRASWSSDIFHFAGAGKFLLSQIQRQKPDRAKWLKWQVGDLNYSVKRFTHDIDMTKVQPVAHRAIELDVVFIRTAVCVSWIITLTVAGCHGTQFVYQEQGSVGGGHCTGCVVIKHCPQHEHGVHWVFSNNILFTILYSNHEFYGAWTPVPDWHVFLKNIITNINVQCTILGSCVCILLI